MGKLKNKVKGIIQLFKEEKKVPVMLSVPDSELLKKKVALITGGSGGIGMAIAKQFLDAGADVIITGTNTAKLEKCAEKLRGGKHLKVLQMNVADVEDVRKKVEEATTFFDGKIDILVNSAGVISHGDFLDITEAEYDRVMNINTKGTFFVSQAVSKVMIRNKSRGHILNITSASAIRPAVSPYHVSKWAVRGLTVGLADMLIPYGIVVNAIGPGPTATAMLSRENADNLYHGTNPAGRYILPEEVASLALLMVSGKGDMIVGDTLYITGGGGITSLHK
ncbi:MAG: SDR family oxidoreductase [Ruminococcus sp.]|nr:SDR family oxidoreductase [Ruminococcus sp.]